MMTDRNEIEIYVHIPFCVRKCAYCDFLSAPADEESRFVYIKALKNEIAGKASRLKNIYGKSCEDEGKGCVVTSIFVGGGTPTILDGDTLGELLECIKNNYCVADDAEITFECNPGTADYEKLKKCRDSGYNRISIGLQSALDDELKSIGRIHSWKDFEETYNSAVACGFDNINVDLMSALPGQTLNSVISSLDRIMALKPVPRHISSYSLILEENTAFWRLHEEGKLMLPDEDTERAMHWAVFDRLGAEGYQQYELSNLAQKGFECRHNIGYWTRRDYAGFGIGAASLTDNTRYTNTSDIGEYVAYWNSSENEHKTDDFGPVSELTELSEDDIIEEYMFLGLRLTEGIDITDFGKKFNKDIYELYGEVIDKNIRDGLLEMKDKYIYLTRRGQDLANYVFSQFIL